MKKTTMANITCEIPLTLEELPDGYFHVWSIAGFHITGRDEREAQENAERALKSHVEKLVSSKVDSYQDAINYLQKTVGSYGRFVRLISGTIRNVIHDHGPITDEVVFSVSKRVVNQIHGEFKSLVGTKYSAKGFVLPPNREGTV